MAHPLEALLVLQEKDRKIAKLKREIRDIPARKADIEKLQAQTRRFEEERVYREIAFTEDEEA